MFDDDKMNDIQNNQDVKKNEEIASETKAEDASESKTEAPLGKVIPFNPDFEPQAAVDSMNAALEEVVSNLRTAFSELGKQLAPLRDGLKEVSNVLKDGVKDLQNTEADENAEEKASDNVEPETKAEESNERPELEEGSAAAAIREASDAVAQGIGKVKERIANTKFDIKGAVSREFENFADANLKDEDYTVDENGKRVVKVDGKFVQNYANEVVPALLKGAIGSFFKTLLGEDILAKAEAEAEAEAEDADEEANEANEETHDEEAKDVAEDTSDDAQKESKYRVQFDFSNAFADMLKNAKVSSENSENTDERELDVSRAALIEGGRIVEDVLNGKGTGNIEERVGKAMEDAAKEDAEKSPEDIKAIDEKHKRILELAQQYEHNMNPDND